LSQFGKPLFHDIYLLVGVLVRVGASSLMFLKSMDGKKNGAKSAEVIQRGDTPFSQFFLAGR
jgi:hypothetical protein